MDSIRLNKFIAQSTGISRREADEAITANRVRINGNIAPLGSQVTKNDTVTLDSAPVVAQRHYTYLMLNKPVGYVCSRRRQGDSPTIYELLPDEYRSLKTVGRLDRDSSGLILLTNDGDFTHQMTHPSFHKNKTYIVELNKPLEPLHQQMISDHGIQLDDGPSKFEVEKLAPEATSFPSDSAFPAERRDTNIPLERSESDGKDSSKGAGRTLYRITMHEGRNRQIRRTFAALGYTVTRLHRTHFGNFALGDLKPGKIQEITI